MSEYAVITESMVDVVISSNITSFNSQKKFDKAVIRGFVKTALKQFDLKQ